MLFFPLQKQCEDRMNKQPYVTKQHLKEAIEISMVGVLVMFCGICSFITVTRLPYSIWAHGAVTLALLAIIGGIIAIGVSWHKVFS